MRDYKMKILAVIGNYGKEQLNYLNQIIIELKSFKKYDVTVIVNSNIEIDNPLIDQVNIPKVSDNKLILASCGQVIYDNMNKYDGYIFSENDMLWKEHHLDNHFKYSAVLPENRIPGLIRYEIDPNGNRTSYVDFHCNNWKSSSKETYDKYKFCQVNNVHQGCYFLTNKQLNYASAHNRDHFTTATRSSSGYGILESSNTDLFDFSNWEKVICISEFESNIIHHMPNIYVVGANGRKRLALFCL